MKYMFPQLGLAAGLAAILGGCGEPDVFIPPIGFGSAKGIIEGTVTYVGPAPCTENGKILGSAVILAFDTRLLPPPEGLGTSAANIDIVPGELLFAGVRDQLAFAKDGKRVCGDPGSPITVSSQFSVGAFDPAIYQIRGFYDLDGDFFPAFSISNLPTKGDIGGGAIENATEVLAGAAPKYREIQVGVLESGALKMPDEGFFVDGVSVTLGLSLPLDRPIFYAKDVIDEFGSNKDPANIQIPQDFQLEDFNPINANATESSFPRVVFGAGMPKDQATLAKESPFFLPLDAPSLVVSRQDVDGDGVITSADHTPESALVPALFPVAVFAKLIPGQRLLAQSAPTVVLQGLTMYGGSLTGTIGASSKLNLNEPASDITVAIRPAVVCLDPTDPTKPGTLLASHEFDRKDMTPIIGDPDTVKASLKALFHRDFEVKYGCLPEGEYSMNLIYGTGQAWTVPNEAGVCAPTEKEGDDTCGTRPRLASQNTVLTITKSDGAYCKDHPTPAECLPPPAEE